MAVQDVQWELGSATLYASSGAAVAGYWGLGSAWVTHEDTATVPEMLAAMQSQLREHLPVRPHLEAIPY